MTANTLMTMLDRNHQHGILFVHAMDGSVYEIAHLETSPYEGTQLRFWFFDEKGNLFDTQYRPAPNGEMDLLAEYADALDTHGIDGRFFKVVWC